MHVSEAKSGWVGGAMPEPSIDFMENLLGVAGGKNKSVLVLRTS